MNGRNLPMNLEVARPGVDTFWGEMAPCEHVLQVYRSENVFMDTLAGFIGDGLERGEATIVIATAAHRSSLEVRLREAGHDLDSARADARYIALDAAETLSRFLRQGFPDTACFERVVRDVVLQARGPGRPVRAFGEMVALLWAGGLTDATLRLEQLWNELLAREQLTLFCAYPRIGATRDLSDAFTDICAAHSQVAFV